MSDKFARNRMPIGCFAAWCKDSVVRAESTSGGAFPLFAEVFLSGGGTVYGAVWDSDFHHVRHEGITSKKDIPRLCKSKYVWSDPTTAYTEVAKIVAVGGRVLFCGTPCQCKAITSLIQSKHPASGNCLVTIDFVCHGTPPPEAFETYAIGLEAKAGSELVDYDFREKRDGWNFPRIAYRFASGKKKRIIPWLDSYFRDFSLNRNLREGCYRCPFAGIDRPSDITIADCWRVGASHPKWDDNKGCSNVLINTEKGLRLWECVCASGRIEAHEYDLREAQMHNHSLMEPSKRNLKSRPSFYYWVMYWIKRMGWFYFRRYQ